MKPKPHQLSFPENEEQLILGDSGGTGKTLTAMIWARERIGNGCGLIVTKLDLKEKWAQELEFLGPLKPRFDIVHYEFLRNKKPPRNGQYTVMVMDEAHLAAAPLFVRGRSKQAEGAYNLLSENPGIQVLPCTATVIRSNPWNLHTLLTFAGHYVDWKVWREHFFEHVKPKWSAFPVWMPKKDWRKMLVPTLKRRCRLLLMSDVADAPKITDIYLRAPVPKFDIEQQEEWSPSKVFHEKRKWENGDEKLKYVMDLADEYRKVIIVFYYIEQGKKWYEEFSKRRNTSLVYGDTKNAERVVAKANAEDECVLLVQSQKSTGWDGDGFDTIIFATPGYPYVDYQQMRWRVTRIKDLKPVQYIHVIGGPADAAVIRQLKLGNDFNPEYFNKADNSTEVETTT